MILQSRFTYFLPLILMLASDQSQASEQTPIQQKLNDLREYLLDAYGPRQLHGIHDTAPEVTAEVKNILQEIQLADIDSIHIKRLSILGRRILGEKNAFVWHYPGFPRFLYVSEDWFKALSPEEKRFIIGHEGMHLKLNHVPARLKTLSLCVMGSIMSGYGIGYLIHKKFSHYGKIPMAIGGFYGSFVTLHALSQSFLLKVYRAQELEADREAARALQCIEGGLKILDAFQEDEDAIEAELPQRPFLVNMRKQMRLNATHPTNEDRKKALLSLKDNNQKK